MIQYYWRETDTQQHKDTSLGTPSYVSNKTTTTGGWRGDLLGVECRRVHEDHQQGQPGHNMHNTQHHSGPVTPPPHRHKTSSQGKGALETKTSGHARNSGIDRDTSLKGGMLQPADCTVVLFQVLDVEYRLMFPTSGSKKLARLASFCILEEGTPLKGGKLQVSCKAARVWIVTR